MPKKTTLKFMNEFSEYNGFLTFINRRTGRMAEYDRRGIVTLFTKKGRVETNKRLKFKRK